MLQSKANSHSDTDVSRKTPVHLLGISQILSYGLLFYAIAPLKAYLAAATGLDQSVILTILSCALVLQAALMPAIGSWCDRHGALPVMRLGFFIGAAGMFALGSVAFAPFAHPLWLGVSFLTIGVGLAMSTYEVAFSAAVQFDEVKSRRNISIITFYGGIASSLAWLSIYPLLKYTGLFWSCCVIAAILAGSGVMISLAARKHKNPIIAQKTKLAPFSWSGLQTTEKRAMIVLGIAGAIEYTLFSATTLLWINWFELKFHSLTLAVILASTYGPFQVVGRVLEMAVGARMDARLTSLIACLFVPLSLVIVQSDMLIMGFVAMALFGMGHGVLTVSLGFITNLYFRAEIYGRAKGLISAPRVLGSAIGPSLGGILFAYNTQVFMSIMIVLSIGVAAAFASLLLLKPTNEIHIKTKTGAA